MERKEFVSGKWQEVIDVRDFIQKNYTLYEGDSSFLAGISEKTEKVWNKCLELLAKEQKLGILDVETTKVSGICNFAPGYIDKENEVIVGLQTDAPLKRIVNLYGGTRMAEQSLAEYGYELDPKIKEHFTEYRKTHNQGVFDAYPKSVRAARSAGLLTGLPDAYGRGRIIGDYRRIPLYGTARLIEEKQRDLLDIDGDIFIGFIDLIVKDKNTGRYIVVDHKSKSKFKNEEERDEYARQLYLYALYIKAEYGEFPSHLIFNMFRANDVVTIDFDEKKLEKAVFWFKNTIENIKKDNKFDDKITILFRQKKKPLKEFKKDDFFCNELCGVRSYCNRSRCYKKNRE